MRTVVRPEDIFCFVWSIVCFLVGFLMRGFYEKSKRADEETPETPETPEAEADKMVAEKKEEKTE